MASEVILFRFFFKSLKRQVPLIAFFGGLLPVFIIGFISVYYTQKAFTEDTFHKLSAAAETKKEGILLFFRQKIDNLTIFSKSGDIKEVYDLMQMYESQLTGPAIPMDAPRKKIDTTSQDFNAIYRLVDPFFKTYVSVYRDHEIYYISDTGYLMYTTRKNEDLGTSLIMGKYKESVLARVFAEVKEEKKGVISDGSSYPPLPLPSFFIGKPVLDHKGNLLCVLVLQLSLEKLSGILKQHTMIDHGQRTFLVNQNMQLRSTQEESAGIHLEKSITTPAVRSAVKGQTGVQFSRNAEGKTVLSAYTPLGLKKYFQSPFEWYIICEVEKEKAFEPIDKIMVKLLIFGVLAVLLTLFTAYFGAKYMVIPMNRISGIVQSVSSGNLTKDVPLLKREDELGSLVLSFKQLIDTLKNQTRQIKEGTNTIVSSISQISATATELAHTASQTSSSVSQMVQTATEIRKIAVEANEKANEVAKSAEEAKEISETGISAAHDVSHGMDRISEEMGHIGKSILKLYEQSQSIGEIIEAVMDLADQSNLLSVNAAIEAAKAGEHGKGFSVVAKEVKSLSDQSKNATNQIRTILMDIRKATDDAVLANKRGRSAVDEGVNLAAKTRQAIDVLTGSVQASAKQAGEIDALSKRQFYGMEDLSLALNNIKDVTEQNMEGARQLESATKDLDVLGKRLNQIAETFKV